MNQANNTLSVSVCMNVSRLLVAVACSSLAGCVELTQPAVDWAKVSLHTDQLIADQIKALPPWPATMAGMSYYQPFTPQDRDQYMLTALRFQKVSLSTVRAGIKLTLEDSAHGGLRRELHVANTFLLLRFMFELPETVSQQLTGLVRSPYIAWVRASRGISGSSFPTYLLGWPVTFNQDGSLGEIDHFRGVMGGEHNILNEFDWISATYPLRALPSCVNRCGTYSPSATCQCDTVCDSYGDCCVDDQDECS